MTKIERLILACSGADDLIKAFQQYAESYARKCLEIAADEASVKNEWNGDYDEYEQWATIVDTDSILNIKLPEHE